MNKKKLPEFNPANSGNFVSEILEKLSINGLLIGRLAVWAWVPENSDKQAYTKGLDIAVTKADLFLIKNYFQQYDYDLKELIIGGINVKDGKDINVDFIDRSSIDWADYSALFEEAIQEAVASDRRITVGDKELYLASIEYLITMKLAASERKDEHDAGTLLMETDDIDFQKLRPLLSKHLGSVGMSRFEVILRDIGHKESRLIRYQTES